MTLYYIHPKTLNRAECEVYRDENDILNGVVEWDRVNTQEEVDGICEWFKSIWDKITKLPQPEAPSTWEPSATGWGAAMVEATALPAWRKRNQIESQDQPR